MIPELQEIYDNSIIPLKGFIKSTGSALKYQKLLEETTMNFKMRLSDAAVTLDQSKKYSRIDIESEVDRLITLFKKIF